jgi:hypothetical protein
MPREIEELRALVRRLHVHYDVEPELDLRGGARVRIGLFVRLWGVHAKGSGPLPGCPKCREIFSRLQLVAEYALEGETSMQIALEPLRRALYDSRVVPGTDEIALPIRITAPAGDAATPARGGEERCLKLIRARLKELGVSER